MTRIPSVEVWVWACICAALVAIRVYPTFIPNLSNDAFQYLSMAEHALAGRFGYTSLIFFDAERTFGVTPAPVATFPMGYSLAIALVSLTGLPLQSAALLISALATVGCVPLLARIAGELGLSRLFRNVFLAVFVFNGAVIDYGSSALSEAPFTFLILLGVALLVSARIDAATSRGWRWAAAGLVFGAAYYMRYAALFFLIGLAVLAIRQLVASNRSLAKGYAIAFAVASVAVLPGIARNILLVGNWRGGNEKIISNPLWSVLLESARAANGILLGPGLLRDTLIPRVLFTVLFLAGLAWVVWSYRWQREARAYRPPAVKGMGIDLMLLVLSYSGCMFYAGLTSVISYSSRMFVPVTPLLLLMLSLALHTVLDTATPKSASRRLAVLALGTSFCVYLFLNLFVFQLPPPADTSPAAGLLDSTSSNGKAARAAVQDLVGPRGVIVSNNAQAIGHVLGRPTVSLVGPHWSRVEWNEQAVRDTVQRFKAAALVICVPTAGQWEDDNYIPSAFVRELAQANPPGWLTLVYRSSETLVYAPRPPDS